MAAVLLGTAAILFTVGGMGVYLELFGGLDMCEYPSIIWKAEKKLGDEEMKEQTCCFTGHRTIPVDQLPEIVARTEAKVRNEKRAAWWIDHRDRNGLSVVRNIFMEQYNKKLEL